MAYRKIVPAVVVASLIAGVGLAHGYASVLKQSVVTSVGSSGTSPDFASSIDPDMKDRQDRKVTARDDRTRDRDLRDRHDRDYRDRDRHDIDRQDRESPEASVHHDGDDHNRGLVRADFKQDSHREAVREIMNASHIRVAMLYSPAHHAGYHARMHRHSR